MMMTAMMMMIMMIIMMTMIMMAMIRMTMMMTMMKKMMVMMIYLRPPAIALPSLFWFLLPVMPRRVRKPEWLILMLCSDAGFRC